MTKTIKSLFRWQPSWNYANLRKMLMDDRVASIGFLLFMVSGTRIHKKKLCIYFESHLTHLAAGLLANWHTNGTQLVTHFKTHCDIYSVNE